MKTPAKVLFISPHLDGGGSERVLLNLLNSINRTLIEPELLVFEKGGSFMKLLNDDIKLVLNKVQRPRYAAFEISKLIKENRYDAIFVIKHYMLLIVSLALKLSGVRIPIIYREITHVSTEVGKNFTGLNIHKLYNNSYIYGFLYRRTSAIIAPSEEIKKDLISRFGVSKEKITRIYNPVDIRYIEEHFTEEVSHPWFREDIPLIVSAGRLVKQKNFELLIDAFKMLTDTGNKARLVILGKGEKREELISMIENLKLTEKAVILEHQMNPFKYISRASIFVLSSLWEGFPNILLEAMACGTAVISTDCPSGPGEIITNGVDGLLVESNNAYQLCAAMLSLLDNERVRNRLGEAGRKNVSDKYTIEKVIPLYMKVFAKTLSSDAGMQ